MLITGITITIVNESKDEAFASIVVNDIICIQDIRIYINNNNKFSLTMPRNKLNEKKVNSVFLINKESRIKFEILLFQAYLLSKQSKHNKSIFYIKEDFRIIDFFNQEIQQFYMIKEPNSISIKKNIIPFNTIFVRIKKSNNKHNLAYVKIIIDNIFAINFLKIVKINHNSLIVSFPTKKIGLKYKNNIFPISSTARQYIEKVIFEVYIMMITNNDTEIEYTKQKNTTNDFSSVQTMNIKQLETTIYMNY